MRFAAPIVRAQWVLFSEAAGVLPNNAREISQRETGSVGSRGLGWAGLGCPAFIPLQRPSVLQRERDEQHNGARHLFARSGRCDALSI